MTPSAVAKLSVDARSTSSPCAWPVLGEPEVEDLHLSAQVEHQVLGLQVAVHHPGRVRMTQRVRHVAGDPQRLPQLERAALRVEERPQGPPLDVLHGDEDRVLGLVDRVHRGDAGVQHRRGRLRLTQKADPRAALADDVVVEHLERDLTAVHRVLGEVHPPHAARPEQTNDPIGPEGLPAPVARTCALPWIVHWR
jgi:hypothetical protein